MILGVFYWNCALNRKWIEHRQWHHYIASCTLNSGLIKVLVTFLRRVINNLIIALHRRVYSTACSVLSECLWTNSQSPVKSPVKFFTDTRKAKIQLINVSVIRCSFCSQFFSFNQFKNLSGHSVTVLTIEYPITKLDYLGEPAHINPSKKFCNSSLRDDIFLVTDLWKKKLVSLKSVIIPLYNDVPSAVIM